MVDHDIWIIYPVPALLYDAQHGVNLSRLLVLDYFRTQVDRQETPAPAVVAFVAAELGTVLDADDMSTAAQRMFNRHGKKPSTLSPIHRDMKLLGMAKLDASGHLRAPDGKDITRATDRQIARETRIWKVQRLLDERAQNLDPDRLLAISDELINIYRDPSSLD